MNASSSRLLTLHVLSIALAACAAPLDDADAVSANIINGRDATSSELTSTVGLGGCSAVIVGERLLLTAAHCVAWGPVGGPQLSVGSIIGISTETTFLSSYRNYRVAAVRSFQPWHGSYFSGHDLALVKLVERLPIGENGRAQIATFDRTPVSAGQTVTLGGFGCDAAPYQNSGRLRIGTATVMQRDYFPETFATTYGLKDPNATLCPGDSGGGVFVPNTNQVIGINSQSGFGVATYVRFDGPVGEQVAQLIARHNATRYLDIEPWEPSAAALNFVTDRLWMSGCGNGEQFCRGDAVPRARFARAFMHALDPTFMTRGWTVPNFNDLSTNPADWDVNAAIMHMRERQLTSGCYGNSFCPNDSITRDQALVFFVRARYGESFPVFAQPYFDDVPSTHPFFRYVQMAAQTGLTSGCGYRQLCAGQPLTREELAVLLHRAFGS